MASVTLPNLDNPADIVARYETALANDQLVQSSWHSTAEDGRWLACALGVIGSDVCGPGYCPASVMPHWLAQMVPAFFDRQKLDDAKDWGLRFYKALASVDGNVPFAVVHYWQAHTVCQLGIDAAEKHDRDKGPHETLQAMHIRALGGEKISADEWRPVLKTAYADADSYADSYSYADADTYAESYSDSYAYSYAEADSDSYAYSYSDSYAYSYAYAWKRMADGMIAAIIATGGAA